MAYIKLDRKFFEGKFWTQKRTFSQAEAWIDLIQKARFEAETETKLLANGRMINIKRGEIHASLRYLADHWGWGVEKTKRFIDIAIKEHAIERRTEQGESIITLLNYELYNDTKERKRTPIDTQTYTPSITPTSTPTEQTKEGKERKKRKEENNSVAKAPVSLHTICKEIFHEKFRQLFGEEYYWEAKDGANLNGILKKIKFNREKKNFPNDDQSIISAFKYFLDSISDDWILKNFSVSNINSKFNEIVSQVKNGTKKESHITDI